MRKVCLLVLLHILVLGGIWLWRSDPDPAVHPGDPAWIGMTGQDMQKSFRGELMLPGQPPADVEIDGHARVSLWIYLPESMLENLRRDSPVSIRLQGGEEDVLTGRVSGVDSASRKRSGETYYRVLLEIDADPDQIKDMKIIDPHRKNGQETQ